MEEENTTATLAEEPATEPIVPEIPKIAFLELSKQEGGYNFPPPTSDHPVALLLHDTMQKAGKKWSYGLNEAKTQLGTQNATLRIHNKCHLPWCWNRAGFDWLDELIRWQGEKFDIVLGSGQSLNTLGEDRIKAFRQAYLAKYPALDLKEVLIHCGVIGALLCRIENLCEMHITVTPRNSTRGQVPTRDDISWMDIKRSGIEHPVTKEDELTFYNQNLNIEAVLTTPQNYTTYPYP